MTAPAVHAQRAPAPVRVPAVASTAIRHLLSGRGKRGSVLGTSSHAVWFLVDDDVVVASTRDASRLPNGVEVAAEAADRVFRTVQHGSFAVIGPDRIVAGNLAIDVVRWWDPRPVLPSISRPSLDAAVGGLPSAVTGVDEAPLWTAMISGSPMGLTTAAKMLIGKGAGLTPEGDDYLAGALAAARILGEAVGDLSLTRMLDAASMRLSRLAHERTTTFSAALIDHAVRGNVAAPAGAFIRSLAGRGDIQFSHRALLEVGHSSGPALAAGIVLGARTLCSSTPRPIGGT